MKRAMQFVGLIALLCAVAAAQNATPVSASQDVVPRLIRFSGQVKGTGKVGITFTLHKSQQDNSALWIETQNVQLDATGRYSVLLGATKSEGIPTELFSSGEAQWLGVRVENQPEQPRVLLVSVPYALKAAEAETLAGHSASEFVTSDKLAGAVQQQVEQAHFNTAAAKHTNGLNGVINTTATTFTDSTTSQVVSVIQNGTGQGLVATAKSGTAISGISNAATGATIGLLGQSASTSGIGIRGFVSSSTGVTIGLFGSAASISGTAIAATESATTGFTTGLQATVSSVNGIAAVIQNKASGKILSGRAGSNEAEVFSVDGAGNVLGNGGTFNAGVFVTTPSGNAVNGTSASGNGVLGFVSNLVESEAGVLGIGNKLSASYISYDISSGVWGDTGTATATTGGAPWYVGVIGTADDGHAGVFINDSANWTTMYLLNNGTAGTGASASGPFGTLMAATRNGTCGIGGQGDLTCTGQVKTLATTGGGTRKVETYAMQSPENWMEDFGSGKLAGGVAVVKIDTAFAETVSETADYHVFLTPNGDSKGLYVVQKSATSFEVRESGGGTSSLSFDYRIVAKRRGFEGQRMTDVTETFKAAQNEANHLPRAKSQGAIQH